MPSELGHPGIWIDAEHPAAGRLELPGGSAGAAPNVEDIRTGAGGDDPLHQALG